MADPEDSPAFRRFAQRQGVSRLADGPSSATRSRPKTSKDIVEYALRDADSVFDLEMERLLKTDPTARHLYFTALGRFGTLTEGAAVAASGGDLPRGTVGDHAWRLVEAEGDIFLIVKVGSVRVPKLIEVRGDEGDKAASVRLKLPSALDGIIQFQLDLSVPEHADLYRLLMVPERMVWLG